jgi:hypothetical protein
MPMSGMSAPGNSSMWSAYHFESVSVVISGPPDRNCASHGPANGAVPFRLMPTTVAQ